ncbi:MAG: hypothetical protein ACE5FG_09090 [Myxococcota bacterium]
MLQEAGLGDRVRVGLPAAPPPAGGLGQPGTGSGSWEQDLGLQTSRRVAPQGRLIEIGGAPSSGRTALAYRIAAHATARGEPVAWVDLPDALDPRSLQRAGVDLGALLWARPPGLRQALRAVELLLRTGFKLVVTDLEGASPRALRQLGTAAWSRLQRPAREVRATVLLLGDLGVSAPFSSLTLHTEKRRARFEQGLFEGLDCTLAVSRQRGGPEGLEYLLRLSQRPAAG